MLPKTVGLFWSYKPDKDRAVNERIELYFLDIGRSGIPQLTGEVITDARSDFDDRGQYLVSMKINATGQKGGRSGQLKLPVNRRKAESQSCLIIMFILHPP